MHNHARRHTAAIRQMAGIRLMAVCDTNPDRLKARAAEENVPGYTDLAEMIRQERLDALINVTGDAAHCATTVAALRAGVHVLCEKPLGLNLREVRAMYRAAKQSGRLLFAGLNRRFAPAYVKFHALAAPFAGPGAVLYLEKFYGGFELPSRPAAQQGFVTGIHQADLAVWIGGRVKKIEGISATRQRAVDAQGRRGYEARVCAVLTHAGGMRTFLTVGNRVVPVAEHPLNLERTFFTTSAVYVDQYDFRRVTVSQGPCSRAFEFPEDQLGFLAQARAFVRAIQSGQAPYPPESYLESHRVVFALPREGTACP